ncbi:MAG: DMT family transporter [Gammaproteobacteria bacterium]|nr:DMT family transporter [Gammaproteobacteria bacterium]
MEGILWGLLGALLIGASDCIARVTSRKVSVSILFLMIMGLSLVVLTAWLGINSNWPPWHPQAWAASAASGLLNLVALYFLYAALARGPVTVASPTASTFTVLLVGLNIVAGEPWSWLQIVALCIVFLGVAMLARPAAPDKVQNYDAQWLRGTAAYALAAAMAVSLRMFLAQEAGADLGAMHALYLNRVFALIGAIALVGYALLKSNALSWPRGSMRYLVILQAVFETAALGAFLIGSVGGGRIAATIGFSAFAAATSVFAWLWLKESIGWQRGIWILIVGIGVTLATLGSPH